MTNNQLHVKPLLALLPVLLASCATFSPVGGFNNVEKTTQHYIKQKPMWATTVEQKEAATRQVNGLLAQPLSENGAVQVALLNNPQLQADFYALQIAEADLVQAGRLPNPKFSMLYAKNNGDFKIEQILTWNVLALLTMPKATAIEKQRFAATQNAVSMRVLNMAQQTRVAYFNAVAADESLRYLTQVNSSAKATAEFARRMKKAGNFNSLDLAREHGYYADAALDLARAENAKTQADEHLTQLLGLPDSTAFKLPERLPDLPKNSDSLKQVTAGEFNNRLDLQKMKQETEALAQQLGLTKVTRLINVLEIGPARVLEGRRGDPYKKGFEIGFELPIFDWGGAKVKRAEAQYMQSVNEVSAKAISAASEVRGSYNQYRTNYDVAKHYRDEIVPLRKRVLQENLLRYNGMLIGPFDLMMDARAQVLSVNSYIEALRDFWIAESDLEMSLIGQPMNAGDN